MSALETLLRRLSPPVGEGPFRPDLVEARFRPQAMALAPLLEASNGGYGFMSALQIFGTGAAPEEDITAWNADDGWREEFGELAQGLFAFAQDAFGGQFVVSAQGFEYFNIESAQRVPMGNDLEAWAATLLADWRYWTGFELAEAWQQAHGALARGHRLYPRQPFVLGGDYDVANLWSGRSLDTVGYYGFLAGHLHALEDGTPVEIELPGGKVLKGVMKR